MECPHCGNTEPVYLGVLGKYVWVRCRHCGLDRYIEAPPCFAPTDEALEDRHKYLDELYGEDINDD